MRQVQVRASLALAWPVSLIASGHPAAAQAISFDDVEKSTIEARIELRQVTRIDGRDVSHKIQQNWKISVGSDQTIETAMRSILTGPRGTREASPIGGIFTLGESRDVASRGGGTAAWTFADGKLSFVRTFPAGAYRVEFVFARGADGLGCTANAAYARENGTGPIRLQSPFSGGQVTIVSAKQISSNCKLTKRK